MPTVFCCGENIVSYRRMTLTNYFSLDEKELTFLCSPRGLFLQNENVYAVPIHNSGSNYNI